MKPLQIPHKVDWVLRIVVAVIILQTLRFKFLGAEESVLLFSELSTFVTGSADSEALFRIGTGVIELMAGILLLIPLTSIWGALISTGLMLGAILTHVVVIGIVFNNDKGVLFGVAVVALLGSLAIVAKRLDQLAAIKARFSG